MPASRQVHAVFSEVNAVGPAHSIAEDQVQTATNIDFSLGQGALIPRRGCTVQGTVIAGTSVNQLIRSYSSDSIALCNFYALASNGSIYRSPDGTSWTAIMSGGTFQEKCGMTSFGQFAYIANGTQFIKDDGTNTTDWVKQSPGTPSISINTLAPISYSTGSFSVDEGTSVSGTSTATVATSNNNRITVKMVLNGTSGADLTVNGTQTLGQFGVHFIDLAFDNPSAVLRISQDWSIGDANFYNYFHNDLFPQNALVPFVNGQPVNASAQADPNTLIDAQLNLGTDTTQPLTESDRQDMVSSIRQNNQSSSAVVTRISNVLAPWAVARPDLTLVGTYLDTSGANPWSKIYAVRYTIEFNAASTATVCNPKIYGAQNYPLTDVNVGYTWWQTYATFDSDGNILGESAPSAPSARKTMQNANVTVVTTGTATGSHGITHVITYRQGGFLNDAYAISTVALATATITDTLNDIQALSINNVLERNLLSKTTMPGDIVHISEPFKDRLFFAVGGPTLRWSLPGKPDSFPATSITKVSFDGDNIQALLTWPPGLVIVNRYSVYDLMGNDFENGDWQLTRSGSRHGSLPPRVPIKTPYGIPLLHYDGLTMYRPGEGADQEIPWLDVKYGDAFKGGNSFDPAGIKGDRIPAINKSYIINCAAAYADHKLYISAPTGTSSTANTVYVLDFSQQKMWWYTYPFNIVSLLWDYQDSRLFAATDDGRMMRLENAQQDTLTNGTATTFVWNATTRKYSVPNDTVLEHAYLDCISPGSIKVKALFDGTSTTLSTLTNTARAWQYAALNGTFLNNVEFSFEGTSTGGTGTGAQPVVYQMNFDLMTEPPCTFYWRTDYDENNWTADKLWDVAYFDYALRNTAGTVTAVTFVDNTAVMTNSLVLSSTGRTVTMVAFPAETYGRVAYTTYTSPVLFQHWETRYTARNEPPKINYYRSEIKSLEENICDAFDTDINPNGTVTVTCMVDGTAVATSSLVGTARQSYTSTLPNEQYGRTIWTIYHGTQFKLYNNWFHLRLEPDRWTNFVTPKVSGPEHEWKVFTPEINCLGNTVLATSFIEGTAVLTSTITGTSRQQYTFSIPVRTFGRTRWTEYNAVSGTFKLYPSIDGQLLNEYEGYPEPSRVTSWRTGPNPFVSSHFLKTWSPHLDTINGTVTGTLIVDDVVMKTASFTGDRQQWYTVGLDLDGSNAVETGSRWEAVYTRDDGGKFKHYETKLESEEKPFGKSVWAYIYHKAGGVSQIDMPRFLSVELEALGTVTCTYFVDIDTVQFATGTIVPTGGIQWFDRISLPPGGRGRIFEFRLQCNGNNVKVYKVNLDMMQEGVKNLTRREEAGTPRQEISFT